MNNFLPALHRAAFNDIIFEGRNKAYGAYELRLIYPRHLKRAVAVMLLLSAALAVGPAVLGYFQPAELIKTKAPVVDEKPRVFTDVPVFEQPTPPPAQPVPSTPQVATTAFVKPVIVTDPTPVADASLTTMEQANAAVNIGARTAEGVDAPAAPVEAPVVAPATENPDVVFVTAEVLPAYPGGNAELLRYVALHTKYPPLALRNSIEGRVYVRFVVDETGQVVNPVVVKGIGGGCDEEAVRVLRTLPRFVPGQQNGRPVKVYFNIPITFTMVK